MKSVTTESIGNAKDIRLIGGRLQIKDGQLTLDTKDPFHPETEYFYLKAATNRDTFIKNVRRHYVKYGTVDVFEKASFSYLLKYLPVLKCGERMLALNNVNMDFITDEFFYLPPYWERKWDNRLLPVTENCIPFADKRILPINLSMKEVEYLAPRMELDLPEHPLVVLIPFHTGIIKNCDSTFHVAQIALCNTILKYDYPFFDDKTFSSIAQLTFMLATYGVCAAFVAEHFDQAKPFFIDYCKWWDDFFTFREFREQGNDIVPILGWIVGFFLDILVGIVIIILIFGIIPVLALVTPSIVAIMLATITIGLRRLYLKTKKWLNFNHVTKKKRKQKRRAGHTALQTHP